MRQLSIRRHRFPADVLCRAVWLYFRVTLGLRDVEEMLLERGVAVSYETLRRWTIRFDPAIAANLRLQCPLPSGRWNLDEMVSKIGCKRM